MSHIDPFHIEVWLKEAEKSFKHDLAASCNTLSLAQLVEHSTDKGLAKPWEDINVGLDYGCMDGSPELKRTIADIYEKELKRKFSPDGIIPSIGAIGANYAFLYAHVKPGDHVICQYPTWQQLYSVPKSLGAEVTLWKTSMDNGWQLDPESLESMIKPNTRMIILNNPQNPTGAVLARKSLQVVVDIAKKHDLYILCDEVFRSLVHGLGPSELPPSLLSFDYPKSAAISSMSKAYSLAGVRVGWIATENPEIIKACYSARDYTTVCVSKICEGITQYALNPSVGPNVVQSNIDTAKINLGHLRAFIDKHKDICSWVEPKASSTAFVLFKTKAGEPVDDAAFCKRLQDETGVMLVPGGYAFGEDYKGFIRIGYIGETEAFLRGLKAWDGWLDAWKAEQ
ncbi:hypothetical protein FFLO_00505 [Filobasidium floriforme]|uniref:Aminotransferase class I/classII large domain-containing protein n=1 Tax=Filobasidium floriforme TaxID=5210 RepID=A0A8K0JS65_9TREE|nr:hypothetical protein FFLO_00505 [Filobasidium floriforme]